MPDQHSPNRKGRPPGSRAFAWRSFFQQSTTPVFVLGKGRRLRFANAAWEKLTGLKLADSLGMVCSAHRHSSALAHALAPTPEAQAGKPDRARRASPTGRSGPPWWDITFVPLADDTGTFGVVGFIEVVGEPLHGAARKIPPAVATLREKNAGRFTFDLFAESSPTTARFLSQLRNAATSTAPVWLVGEAGAGKVTAARVIHHASSKRNMAFVAIDCAGLQPYLIGSMLFGHGGVVGANQAGTLYLKEPATLPRDLQQQLAEVLSEPNAPRLICGSTRTANEDVLTGKLISQFHTSLSVLELAVPPLRERLPDMPRFVAHFLAGIQVDPGVLDVLKAQPWSGNLRELAGVLGEAVRSAGGGAVNSEHLPHDLRARAGIAPGVPAKSLALDPLLETVEKRLILLALRKADNHQTRAAGLLRIYRSRLWRRLEALGIPVPPQPPKPREKDGEDPEAGSADR
jgi:transcriptional regulator with PAS, ATPase and Fis domain